MALRFQNKVAVVTGASAGMGYASALRLAKEGAKVICGARNNDKLVEAVAKINAEADAAGSGGTAVAVVSDASTDAGNKQLVDTAVSSFGKLDIAFINAGMYTVMPIMETDEAKLDQVLSLNVKGIAFALKYAMLAMKDSGNGGSIIVNSSGMSTSVDTNAGNAGFYAGSKAFVDILGRYATIEGKPYNIRVNTINPGIVATSIFGPDAPQAAYDGAAKGAQLIGRAGKPEEIANLVAFLASDESTFMLGSNIKIDGGYDFGPLSPPST